MTYDNWGSETTTKLDVSGSIAEADCSTMWPLWPQRDSKWQWQGGEPINQPEERCCACEIYSSYQKINRQDTLKRPDTLFYHTTRELYQYLAATRPLIRLTLSTIAECRPLTSGPACFSWLPMGKDFIYSLSPIQSHAVSNELHDSDAGQIATQALRTSRLWKKRGGGSKNP